MNGPDGYSQGLIEANEALRADLATLSEDMQGYHRSQLVAVAALQDEIETQRILARYNRRTWFEVMAYLTFGTALLSDVGDTYAYNGWWGLLFWTSQHGAGGPWEWTARAIGLAWQVAFVGWLTWRAQVPAALMPRVAKGAPPPVRPERSF